jgi:large subunit ribosomal protein L9
MMKIILLSDINKLGCTGDVLNVKDGFARNFLLPRKFAVVATPANLKQLSKIKERALNDKEIRMQQLRAEAEKINQAELLFVRKVDEHGHLYGSVSESDLVHALAEKGINVNRSMIEMEHHLKDLGAFTVTVSLAKDLSATLNIRIEQE